VTSNSTSLPSSMHIKLSVLVCEITYNVSYGTLNHAHSLTYCLCINHNSAELRLYIKNISWRKINLCGTIRTLSEAGKALPGHVVDKCSRLFHPDFHLFTSSILTYLFIIHWWPRPCSPMVKPLGCHVQYSVTFAVAEDRFEPRPGHVRLLKKNYFK